MEGRSTWNQRPIMRSTSTLAEGGWRALKMSLARFFVVPCGKSFPTESRIRSLAGPTASGTIFPNKYVNLSSPQIHLDEAEEVSREKLTGNSVDSRNGGDVLRPWEGGNGDGRDPWHRSRHNPLQPSSGAGCRGVEGGVGKRTSRSTPPAEGTPSPSKALSLMPKGTLPPRAALTASSWCP